MSRRGLLLALLVLLCPLPGSAAPQVFEGEVPEGPERFFELPFTVPEGVAEVEVRHQNLTPGNTLDWGVADPLGLRGWDGWNQEPTVIGLHAASRSYRAGPLPAGTWKVVVGKGEIVSTPARYRVEVELRTQAALSPQPERAPYVPSPPLRTGGAWYRGDLHVHSKESGDADASLDAIATYARARRLDFVVLTDHNTTSALQLLARAQERHPDLLFIPGVEVTTYSGHALAWNVEGTLKVDPRVSPDGAEIKALAEAVRAGGGGMGLAHPNLDLSECRGCAWELPLEPGLFDGFELGNGAFSRTGLFFLEANLRLWDALLDQGARMAAVGGSDDHHAGDLKLPFESPLGSPTTFVWAEELGARAILQGIRQGRTAVMLEGPEDPFVELTAGPVRVGDTVVAERLTLRAVVTGGLGTQVRLVRNGDPGEAVPVDADPFLLEREVEAPAEGMDRYRAEVVVDAEVTGPFTPRTVTSHLYLRRPAPGTGEDCACGEGGHGPVAALPWLLLAVGLLRDAARRARSRRALTRWV